MKFSTAIGYGAVLFFAVCLNTVSAPAEEAPSDIEIMKKITTVSIRQALGATKSLDEAAARIGVDSDELKRVCLALKIDLPATREKPAPAPVPVPAPTPPPVVAGQDKETKFLNTDIVLDYHGKTPYLLLVDKSAHKLYLLKYDKGKCLIEQTFACKTGQKDGDKKERGDLRTPEGVYFFLRKYSRPDIEEKVGKANAYQYGDMAFVTNFPNVIDELKGKDGGGIWLHGTDESFESTPSRDTHGCVVTTNETIQKLSKYISLEETPIIITDHVNVLSQEEIDSQRQAIFSMIEKWRASWAEKRIDDYIQYYSPSFESQGLSKDQWKERKAGLAKINGNVRVSLDGFTVLKQKDGLVVQFLQNYAADNVSNIGAKTLYLVKEENNWGIVAELFQKSK